MLQVFGKGYLVDHEKYTAALVESFQSVDTNRPHFGGVPATFAGGWPDELPAKA